jgi:hypothetical protein
MGMRPACGEKNQYLPEVKCIFYQRLRSREGAFKFVDIHQGNIWPKRDVFLTQLSVGSLFEHVYNELR